MSFPSLAARHHAAGGISPACLGRGSRWRAAADRGARAVSAAAWTKEHSTAAYPPHLRGGQPGGQAPGRSSTTSALAERLDAAPAAAMARAANGVPPALHARDGPDGWLRAAEPSSQEEASHADRVRPVVLI